MILNGHASAVQKELLGKICEEEQADGAAVISITVLFKDCGTGLGHAGLRPSFISGQPHAGCRIDPICIGIPETHDCFHWIILMLGNNDLKHHFAALPEDVAAGIEKLTVTILHHPYKQQPGPPKILLVRSVPWPPTPTIIIFFAAITCHPPLP